MAVIELATLIVSTVILSKSASVVVEKAALLARFFGISQLAIGMLLIAVSTSLPELSVSTIASAGGNGAIAAGNVFGSNIANILLVLGIGAFAYGFRVNREELTDTGFVLLVTTAIS
ncbi:MAG: sodium:calcium antiporter, partial [Candidatus ainarchaeum sp.]|nr:sodium:calcium antiporter [Candidatus ainarchaeum sp.]